MKTFAKLTKKAAAIEALKATGIFPAGLIAALARKYNAARLMQIAEDAVRDSVAIRSRMDQ